MSQMHSSKKIFAELIFAYAYVHTCACVDVTCTENKTIGKKKENKWTKLNYCQEYNAYVQ